MHGISETGSISVVSRKGQTPQWDLPEEAVSVSDVECSCFSSVVLASSL
jgi:hypothetical protein